VKVFRLNYRNKKRQKLRENQNKKWYPSYITRGTVSKHYVLVEAQEEIELQLRYLNHCASIQDETNDLQALVRLYKVAKRKRKEKLKIDKWKSKTQEVIETAGKHWNQFKCSRPECLICGALSPANSKLRHKFKPTFNKRRIKTHRADRLKVKTEDAEISDAGRLMANWHP
jgi:hypothetical protein